MKKRKKLTPIVALHYLKLFIRSLLLILTSSVYIYNRIHDTGETFSGLENNRVLTGIIWCIFVVGMVLRFFPSRFESMGCQKQFAKNYVEKEAPTEKIAVQPGIVTFSVFAAWIALNAIIGILYYTKIIDVGILLLICLIYSVCDVICILFFCPFQTWFMKNKCCGTCRIYNWDYAMMFTPLIFVPHLYTWSLLGIALALVVRWEITYKRHPERFSEKCNTSLSCAMCKEKLCHHKKQLQGFLKKGRFNLSGNSIFKNSKRDRD